MSEASARRSIATQSAPRRQRSSRPASCLSHNYNGRRVKKFHPPTGGITRVKTALSHPPSALSRCRSPQSLLHSFPQETPIGGSSLLLSVPEPLSGLPGLV